jgi:archaellum biogenesis protein FlaJ (TadC family)
MELLLLSLLGVVISLVLGTLWYSPFTPMGKVHMVYVGFDKLSHEEQQKAMAEAKPKMKKMYLGQGILSFATSFMVVFIMTMTVGNGMPALLGLGFVIANWLCFMVPVVGSSIIWGTCDPKIAWKKFSYDSLSYLVTMIFIALLTLLFI